MGDHAGKPSQYTTSHQVNSAFYPTQNDKMSLSFQIYKNSQVNLTNNYRTLQI